MRISILISGEYGFKIANGIATHGLASNIVGIHEFPSFKNFPELIDDISEYIPKKIHASDLIIAAGLFGDINIVIPNVTKISGAKSIIAPIYHPQQLPLGLQNEIKSKLDNDITIVFPKPFCSLSPIGDILIDKFTKIFGKPKFEIETDNESDEIDINNNISSVKVIHGAPCGSSWFIADNITGIPLKDAEFEANNKLHNFPCSASMITDKKINDTILHLASYRTKEAIKRAIGFTCRIPIVNTEKCKELTECKNTCLKSCPNVLTGLETISHDKNNKAVIDPATCGACENCIHECPCGAIHIYNNKTHI
jgi:NAD-dependent dihydropyrimidine dehydrogenase PreA subunit